MIKELWNCNLEGEPLDSYVVSDNETPYVYPVPIYTAEWVAESTMYYYDMEME
jgi:hypothetical protein